MSKIWGFWGKIGGFRRYYFLGISVKFLEIFRFCNPRENRRGIVQKNSKNSKKKFSKKSPNFQKKPSKFFQNSPKLVPKIPKFLFNPKNSSENFNSIIRWQADSTKKKFDK